MINFIANTLRRTSAFQGQPRSGIDENASKLWETKFLTDTFDFRYRRRNSPQIKFNLGHGSSSIFGQDKYYFVDP